MSSAENFTQSAKVIRMAADKLKVKNKHIYFGLYLYYNCW